MTAYDLACSMISSGAVPNAAFAAAARRTGESFAAIRDEYNRRQRAARAFAHSERDVERERREWQAWSSGDTMTEQERNYYRRQE